MYAILLSTLFCSSKLLIIDKRDYMMGASWEAPPERLSPVLLPSIGSPYTVTALPVHQEPIHGSEFIFIFIFSFQVFI